LSSDQSISDEDWERLAQLSYNAGQLARNCSTRGLWIEQVFGPKADVEKISDVYNKAGSRLISFEQKNYTIDYNGDDAEMHIAGASSPNSGKIKLTPDTLKAEAKELLTVLLHEACHEANASVVDKGYYNTAGFTKMSQKQKMRNAAHYEEVAKRIVGISKYEGLNFIPEATQKTGGGKKNEYLKKEKKANDGLEKLWSFSYNLHAQLRDCLTGGSSLSLKKQVELVSVVKRCYGLGSVGIQEGHPVVSELELALMESTVRVFSKAQTALEKLKNIREDRPRLISMSVKELTLEAIRSCGGFTGNADIDEERINNIYTLISIMSPDDPFPDWGENSRDVVPRQSLLEIVEDKRKKEASVREIERIATLTSGEALIEVMDREKQKVLQKLNEGSKVDYSILQSAIHKYSSLGFDMSAVKDYQKTVTQAMGRSILRF
jgi:hypothetical protein